MGYIRHNAIVVSSWQPQSIEAAAAFARSVGAEVIGPSLGGINNYRTLLVVPDGSKEGWEDSNTGDDAREKIRAWLRTAETDSRWFEWVEVAYSNDDGAASIVDSSWGQP